MGRLRLALWIVATALASTGCLVGPDYKQPKAPVNQGWGDKDDPRLAVDADAEIAWWATFGDPTLDQLIEMAYHQNLPLQVTGLRIIEARAQLGVATGELLPQNVLPAASAQAVGLSEHAPNGAAGDHNFGVYQVGFDALWEPDFWGKYRRGIRAAKATYRATVADYDDALVSLSADVARTYVVIRTFQTEIELANENIRVQEDGLHIAESRFRNGTVSGLDVAQATSLLETTRATVPVFEAHLRQAENAMSTLLGRPTGFVQALVGGPRDIPVPPAKVAVGMPAEILRRRPDIRGAEYRAIAQCDRIGVAKAELLPKFILFGSIGTQTSSGGGAPSGNSSITDIFGPGSLVYNAGVNVFWPILRYPQIMNNVRVEDARYEELLVEYVSVILRAAQEVEDGIIGYLKHRDAAVSQANAVTAAQEAVQLALTQYREGSIDYQRVLDTQRVLLDTQQRLADLRSLTATNLISLYKALGGGWQLREGDPVITTAAKREMEHRTSWGSYLSEPRPEVVNKRK